MIPSPLLTERERERERERGRERERERESERARERNATSWTLRLLLDNPIERLRGVVALSLMFKRLLLVLFLVLPM